MAELARLRPDESAVARLTEELNGILDHVRLLEEVDVAGVGDQDGSATDTLPFRDPDLERDELSPGAPGTIAPAWKDGLFLGPRLPALDGGSSSEESGGGA
jgi:aspartyl/glutamyl-tRNA(Asn/Gln) amidotransferase C subunit